MKLLAVCVLAGVALLAAAEEENDKASYNPVNQKFFVGILRTEMISTATTTTIGVAATTCYNAIGSTTCSGRKRRALPKLEQIDDSTAGDNLHASLNAAADAEVAKNTAQEGPGRLVVWRTTTVTLTYTSSSTVSGTKLSLSYACTASGMNLPPSC
ncbi:uncharacterized protein LOC119592279 isoform X2 [Penaeus monodon]|uniref:uncharacterized protein LOC119592279 isoform X2 n=1 Tax=Penaeus monodon TaxID=6687 RepID=UPI0018A6DB4D|nr:uncharacterized protein LOC119592279 isoform X2 [Penaeus monodon]